MMRAPSTGMVDSILSVSEEPWDWYDGVRALGEIVWDDGASAWLVTSHRLIKEMLRKDIKLWQQTHLNPNAPPAWIPQEDWDVITTADDRTQLTRITGDEHVRVHRWWMKTFSPKVLDQWRESLVRPVIHSQIDTFVGLGAAELGGDFIDAVVPRMALGVLGLPTDDPAWNQRFLELGARRRRTWLDPRTLISTNGTSSPEISAGDREMIDDSIAALREQREMIRPVIEQRISDANGTDIISLVWRDADTVFGVDHSELDLLYLAEFIPEAAVGTTLNAVANALYALATNSNLQDVLRSGGTTEINAFVEESLRVFPTVSLRSRVALEDTELGGAAIKKGDTVVALLGSANRDPEKFECPDQIDLERASLRDHFGFFQGPRSCAGQALARMELQEVVRVAIERLPNLRLDPDAEPPRYHLFHTRRWRPLNVLFS